MSEFKNLADYEHVVRQILPGAGIHPGGPMGGVTIDWRVRVVDGNGLAYNDAHATERVTVLAEQMRIRAIRELGLEPILEAQRAEVNEYKRENDRLRAVADERAKRITELQEIIACETSEEAA